MMHDIFVVPIYEFKLDIDNDKLYNYCNEYKKTRKGRFISNLGGYQSQDLDLDESALHPLIEQIVLSANAFADQVVNSCEQSLSNIWFNINQYKDANSTHNHPQSDISGVYYVKTPETCGQIIFQHPAYDVLSYYNAQRKPKNKYMTRYDASAWTAPVDEGTLYLFPSWLNHRVESNMNKTEDRVSFAFNTLHKKNHKRANKL